jgi:2-dehydro-3-deoxy-D-arabinonate dehydratase
VSLSWRLSIVLALRTNIGPSDPSVIGVEMKFGRFSSIENPYSLVVEENGDFFKIPSIESMRDVMHLSLYDFQNAISSARRNSVGASEWCAPMAPEIEVWGAGVTYLRSRDARTQESSTPDIYTKVYEAARPELFLKGTSSRVVGTGQDIGIRFDAESSIPEPEIALVINSRGECIGLCICNDVTARSIEGENPLYLSQAKVYCNSTALGPYVTPIWEIPDVTKIDIFASITRNGKTVWEAATSFGNLHRSFEDLISYLFRCQEFKDGVILSTGTGIVPPDDIHLSEGDVVRISATHLGELVNRVAVISPTYS